MNTNAAPDFNLEYAEVTGEPPKAPDFSATPPELPEKYRGKSIEDIVKMHQEAERLASRVGNDLAEQRRLTDTLLEIRKTDNAKVPEKKPVTADELFQDPNKAIEQAILNSKASETITQTQQRLHQMEMRLGQREFEERYPTYRQDAQNETFQAWALKNPARADLLRRADQYDFQAANALWDMWAEHKEVTGTSKAVDDAADDRKQRMKAARTVKAAAGEGSGVNKPIYSRAKLMELRVLAAQGDQKARLKIDDPDFQRELTLAYEEGRVR